MIGAIVGDIVGSRFEFNNHRSKKFTLFSRRDFYTDDTVCTVATMDWLLNGGSYRNILQRYCQEAPGKGYGSAFLGWIENPIPYNSFGNGAAMRVSPVGMWARNLKECRDLAKETAEVSHDHPEGIKGAQATAECVYLALHIMNNHVKKDIKESISGNYGYCLDGDLYEIRKVNTFNETCQVCVPQAIMCFLQSKSFEDAIRNAISIGGDSDTIAAITGGMSEAYYSLLNPNIIKEYFDYMILYLPENYVKVITDFYIACNKRIRI
jgi:ADP-ribosyl-[dinitrogen reductase] hydrolase